MKRKALALIACLAAAGWMAYAPPGAFRTPSLRRGGVCPRPIVNTRKTLLADCVVTGDSVTYTTDPEAERQTKREERDEKQKERNSWKMLQNMPNYGPPKKPPASSKP